MSKNETFGQWLQRIRNEIWNAVKEVIICSESEMCYGFFLLVTSYFLWVFTRAHIIIIVLGTTLQILCASLIILHSIYRGNKSYQRRVKI